MNVGGNTTAIEIKVINDGLTRVVLAGRLDTPGVDRIETQFVGATVPAAKNVIVDLSRVDFVASMGIRMFVSVARSMSHRQARIALYGATRLVQEVFEHVALRDILPIADDETAAIAAVSG
jgi:anti-anti-sigma factor